MERALESDKLARENVGLRRQIQPISEPVGKSAAMQQLREQAQRIAQHDTWVLISGEPGSGKKVFARYIHEHSQRRTGPFIEGAVGSLSQENSAVELFGSEEGEELHYGRFEQANGGTLSLGDIADMDAQTQARLLSVLQTHSFLRVGGTVPVRVDLRIIASTHRNLEEEVRAGRFREDLYYHLNVVPLVIQPLREHPEDVPELLHFYTDYYVTHEKLPYRKFSVAAQNRLRNHSWPGNVRELKNLVQRLLILGHSDTVELEEVETAVRNQLLQADAANVDQMAYDMPLREAREQFEKQYLLHQLQEVGGSVGKLAKRVGMERTHLYRKLRGLGIEFKKGGE